MVVSNESAKGLGSAVAGLGAALLVIGLVLMFLPTYGTTWYGTQTVSFPYRSSGDALLIVGIVLIVLGGVTYAAGASLTTSGGGQSYERQLASTKDLQNLLTEFDSQLRGFNVPRASAKADGGNAKTVKFCRHCGQSILGDSSFCEHCGKRL